MSQAKPVVSVIVPVYNAEKYLTQCLDSIISQTLQNIEIICINDGSSDNSAHILGTYTQHDSRIKLVSQTNSGPGIARNNAISIANGDYIAFFDADDFCDEQLLESIYNLSLETDADIGIFPNVTYDEKDGSISKDVYNAWLPKQNPFIPENFAGHLFQLASPGPCSFLFRRSFVEQHSLCFLPQHIAEDVFFVFPALAFAKKICYITEPYYYVRRGISENLSSSLEKYPRETHQSLLKIRNRLEQAGIYETFRSTFRIAAISSSEYIFWHIPYDILPMNERLSMLEELGIADKAFIAEYHGDSTESLNRIQIMQRMLKAYGIDYTAKYLREIIQSKINKR